MNDIVDYSVVLSLLLFSIGILGVIVRRHPIVMFMAIELMLNAGNLLFIAFARHLAEVNGQIYALIMMAVAAAEVAVGLAIIVALYKYRAEVDVDAISAFKG